MVHFDYEMEGNASQAKKSAMKCLSIQQQIIRFKFTEKSGVNCMLFPFLPTLSFDYYVGATH